MNPSRLKPLALFISIILCSRSSASAAIIQGVVADIFDGETITIGNNSHVLKVRICAITVPATNPIADIARVHLAALVKGKSARVEYSQLDTSGIIVGVIQVDQFDVGMQMVRDGAALYNRAYANDLPDQYRRLYEESEEAARNEKRGIWQSLSVATRDESETPDKILPEMAKTPEQFAVRLNDEGYHLMAEGHYAAALPKIREALKLDPKFAAAHKNLALIFCDTGRYQDALPEGQEALKLDPSSDKTHNVMGKILFGLRDDPGSIREYKEAIRLNPKYGKAHYNLGVTLLRARRFLESIDEFHEAERLIPNQPAVQLDLGLAFYFVGRRAEARACWQKVLTMGDLLLAALAESNLSHLPK